MFEGVFGVPHSLESEKVEAMVKKNPRKITIENFINNENQHVVASEDCSVRSIRFSGRPREGLRFEAGVVSLKFKEFLFRGFPPSAESPTPFGAS